MPVAGARAMSGRLALLALGGISLLTGLWGGLSRLGWVLPVPQADWISLHGPLLVCGFLGTLIGLERAVGVGRRWAYLGPLATAVGAGVMIAGMKGLVAPYLMAAGSLSLCFVFAVLIVRQFSWFAVTLGLGALSWFVGNVLFALRREIPEVVLWWGAFLVLTIAGERLELTRLLPMTRGSRALFLAPVALLFLGLFRMEWRLVGAALALFAAWLFRFDIARRTISQTGLVRFTATSLLAGYGWLAVGGVLAIGFGPQSYGLLYDAILHSLFVGFVFSMIFAHAPIIVPAVLRVSIPYRKFFYAPLIVLHLSLALRIGGDLSVWARGRMWGGALNVAAIAFFMGTMVRSAAQERKQREEISTRDSSDVTPVGRMS